jgi:SAM-dependent methyltransferase
MIVSYTKGKADDNMPETILVELAGIVRSHPWWQARAELTLALLRQLGIEPPARVLDVGCGWGVTLEVLTSQGYSVVGLDVSRRTLERVDRPDRTLIEADITQPLPGEIEPFDVVLALDVIEHLDDDRQAIKRLAPLVTPRGRAIVSVPALPALFTEFDAIQGHRRRYLPETLREAFRDTGLVVERVLWWGSWLVPILRWQRSLTRGRPEESSEDIYRRYLRLPPWPLPQLFRAAFALEKSPTLQAKLRTGTSLFAIARPIPDTAEDANNRALDRSAIVPDFAEGKSL